MHPFNNDSAYFRSAAGYQLILSCLTNVSFAGRGTREVFFELLVSALHPETQELSEIAFVHDGGGGTNLGVVHQRAVISVTAQGDVLSPQENDRLDDWLQFFPICIH